jgi:hypothetical protein
MADMVTKPHWFIRGAITDTGENLTMKMKAISYSSSVGSRILWELRRVFSIMYNDRKNVDLKTLLKENRFELSVYFHQIGLDFEMEFSPSMRSAKARGLDTAGADQEHMMSTVGLLAMLLFWSREKHLEKHKERATSVVECLLSNGCAEGFTDGVPIEEAPPACFPLCAISADANGHCQCLRLHLHNHPTHRSWSGMRKLRARLHYLTASTIQVDSCKSIRGWYCFALQAAADAIDGSIEQWTEGDTLTVARDAVDLHSRCKRMRIDYHLRQAVSTAVQERGLASSTSAFCRANGLASAGGASNWNERTCAEFVAANLLSFPRIGSVYLGGDCGRFGRPAEENLVLMGWEHLSDLAFVGPLKVFPPPPTINPLSPHAWPNGKPSTTLRLPHSVYQIGVYQIAFVHRVYIPHCMFESGRKPLLCVDILCD